MDGLLRSVFKRFPAKFSLWAKVRCTLRYIDSNNRAGFAPSGKIPIWGGQRRFIP
jgi:hypothetical protein